MSKAKASKAPLQGPPPTKESSAKGESSSTPVEQKKGQDVVLVHGVTEDKQGLRVLRAREQGLELGEVRPVKEGQPLTQDLVRLKPRKDAPYLCDVETEFSASEHKQQSPVRTQKGPAQVASKTYREGWDAIFANRVSAPGSDSLN